MWLIKVALLRWGGLRTFRRAVPFFTTPTGARLKQRTVQGCFRRVWDQAGIRRLSVDMESAIEKERGER